MVPVTMVTPGAATVPRKHCLTRRRRMPFELVCGRCNHILYFGREIHSPYELLKSRSFRCSKCGTQLAREDFTVDIVEAPTVLVRAR